MTGLLLRKSTQNHLLSALGRNTLQSDMRKTHKALEAILNDGLRPMGRQYVHLSVNTETAVQVGKRRDAAPVILVIDAHKAYTDGIVFYKGNDKVVLADYVPAGYISIKR